MILPNLNFLFFFCLAGDYLQNLPPPRFLEGGGLFLFPAFSDPPPVFSTFPARDTQEKRDSRPSLLIPLGERFFPPPFQSADLPYSFNPPFFGPKTPFSAFSVTLR